MVLNVWQPCPFQILRKRMVLWHSVWGGEHLGLLVLFYKWLKYLKLCQQSLQALKAARVILHGTWPTKSIRTL